jgi:large subunit ribosomal protein L35
LLLLQQPAINPSGYTLTSEAQAQDGVPTSVELNIPELGAEDRKNFDVRAFMAQHGLDAAKGGGAHMWREIWDEQVSKIYQRILSKIQKPLTSIS